MEGAGRRRGALFLLAPIFARSKREKCFKPAESPGEMLATQATVKLLPNSKQIQVTGIKRGKTPTSKSRLVSVLHLIG